jgi:hypothetical protein
MLQKGLKSEIGCLPNQFPANSMMPSADEREIAMRKAFAINYTAHDGIMQLPGASQ